MNNSNKVISLLKVSKTYEGPPPVKAINGVSIEIQDKEFVAIVGESGSGKTTIAKIITNIHTPTSGQIYLFGKNILEINNYEKKSIKKHIQMIFQDPFSSLNPRMTLFDIVGEPLLVNGMKEKKEREERVSKICLLYTSPSPRDATLSRMPSSA